MIKFDVFCNPPTATSQQKGAFRCGGGIRFFTKPHVKQAQIDLAEYLRPFSPEERLEGALFLSLKFKFPMRKSETKARRALGHFPHDKRPDVDNLAKLTVDVMASLGWFKDDAQIARMILENEWSNVPGIIGDINEL